MLKLEDTNYSLSRPITTDLTSEEKKIKSVRPKNSSMPENVRLYWV